MSAGQPPQPSRVQLLRTAVQHYDWGSTTTIPRLLGVEPDGRPWAELWVGAHPQAPSRLARDSRRLDEVVAGDPAGQLGVAEPFGRLPFLLKLLAAARPLSLQAHPSADQAARGYRREEAAGIARDAPQRTYRDDGPKPEIACALTRFSALSGFRPLAEAAPVLRALDRGAGSPGGLLLSDVVRSLLDPPGDDAAAPDEAGRLAVAVRALLSLDRGHALDRGDAAELARAAREAAASARRDPATPAAVLAELDLLDEVAVGYPDDPGIVVVLLLNHIVLAPGQALYTPAGVLHAYLSGTAVELMAASDNVVRGGLTGKHVDLPELLNVLDTTSAPPTVVAPVAISDGEFDYPTPTPQFRLSRVQVAPGGSVRLARDDGPQLLLCVLGAVRVDGVQLGAGQAAYVAAGAGDLELTAAAGPATVFRARVPR